jgi:hypothetical protein
MKVRLSKAADTKSPADGFKARPTASMRSPVNSDIASLQRKMGNRALLRLIQAGQIYPNSLSALPGISMNVKPKE